MRGPELVTDTDDIVIHYTESTLFVTFNRPARHDALTQEMYAGLLAACDRAETDESVRVLVLQGAGGRAFASGSDVAQFVDLRTAEDGEHYERRMTTVLDRLTRFRKPTVAVLRGLCVGAGLLLAAACDARIAGDDARLSLPVAKTVGNCLSANSLSLLTDRLGSTRVLDLLATARVMPVSEAIACGFVGRAVPPDALPDATTNLCRELAKAAPLTLWSAKEILHRIRTSTLPDDADVLATVYESHDFAAGVASFVKGTPTTWTGR